MSRNEPAISTRSALPARMFQLLFPLVFRFQYMSPDVQFATKKIAKPRRIIIPTRHGDVRALVYSPTAADIEASLAELPPTLILTGDQDTLRHEMNALADDLAAQGVEVTRREFAGVDHGFTHAKPVGVAREAIELIGEHLRKAYA